MPKLFDCYSRHAGLFSEKQPLPPAQGLAQQTDGQMETHLPLQSLKQVMQRHEDDWGMVNTLSPGPFKRAWVPINTSSEGRKDRNQHRCQLLKNSLLGA